MTEKLHDELVFVGFTNGSQILYASEAGTAVGEFYRSPEHDCCIPLYMLRTHWHRLQSTTNGEVTLERVKEAQLAAP